MKHIKLFSVVTAALLCLALAACGESAAGKAWRTTGVVAAQGTLTRGGEEVYVCLCLDQKGAALYLDDETHTLFGSVQFPDEMTDAVDSFSALAFPDWNDDGESDVELRFSHADMSEERMVWLWNAASGEYTYAPEYYSNRSEVAPDPTEDNFLSDYIGIWAVSDENLWLCIFEDAAWSYVNSQNEVIEYGVVLCDADGIELHYDGSGDVQRLDRTPSGTLVDLINDLTLVQVEAVGETEAKK